MGREDRDGSINSLGVNKMTETQFQPALSITVQGKDGPVVRDIVRDGYEWVSKINGEDVKDGCLEDLLQKIMYDAGGGVKLKPCPFCGTDDARMEEYTRKRTKPDSDKGKGEVLFQVKCGNCWVRCRSHEKTSMDAAQVWNRRKV